MVLLVPCCNAVNKSISCLKIVKIIDTCALSLSIFPSLSLSHYIVAIKHISMNNALIYNVYVHILYAPAVEHEG